MTVPRKLIHVCKLGQVKTVPRPPVILNRASIRRYQETSRVLIRSIYRTEPKKSSCV